jgi:hypothetical protein
MDYSQSDTKSPGTAAFMGSQRAMQRRSPTMMDDEAAMINKERRDRARTVEITSHAEKSNYKFNVRNFFSSFFADLDADDNASGSPATVEFEVKYKRGKKRPVGYPKIDKSRLDQMHEADMLDREKFASVYSNYRFVGKNFLVGEGGHILRRSLVKRDQLRGTAHIVVIVLAFIGLLTNIGAHEIHWMTKGANTLISWILVGITLFSSVLCMVALYWMHRKEYFYQRAIESSVHRTHENPHFVDTPHLNNLISDLIVVALIPIPGINMPMMFSGVMFDLHTILTALSFLRLKWLLAFFAEMSDLRSEQMRVVAVMHNIKLEFSMVQKFLVQNDTAVVGVMSLAFMLANAYVMLIVERPNPAGLVKNFDDSLWLIFITMTTVGYGDFYPTTFPGRFIAVVASLGAIAVISFLVNLIMKAIDLNPGECKFFTHIGEMKRDEQIRKCAGAIILDYMRRHKENTLRMQGKKTKHEHDLVTSPLLHDWEEHKRNLATRGKYLDMQRLKKERVVEEENKEDLEQQVQSVSTLLEERMSVQDHRLDRVFALLTSKLGNAPDASPSAGPTASTDPLVQQYLLRVQDPKVREILDRLVKELRTKYSRVSALLNKMDVNRDGVLSKSEILSALTKFGIKVSASELENLMATFDPSGDGKVNLAEFSTVLAQHQAHH